LLGAHVLSLRRSWLSPEEARRFSLSR
jgi:hypothetical protein